MRIVNRSEYVQIDWTVGNTCNYNCSYCPGISKDGSSPWPEIQQAKEIVETLVKTYKNKKLHFMLLGGEITLWKHFVDFVDMLRSTAQDCKIKLLTNGIMPKKFWNTHGHKFDKIQFSFHTGANVTRFIENINSSTCKVNQIYVMIDPSCFDESIEIYKKLCSDAVNAYSVEGRLLDSRAGTFIMYTQEQKVQVANLLYFNSGVEKVPSDVHLYEVYDNYEVKVKNPLKYIHEDQNNWLGWKCYIGIEKITLRADGSITRGSSCSVGGVIGNWRKNILNLNNFNPVTCNMKKCTCGADIIISRHP